MTGIFHNFLNFFGILKNQIQDCRLFYSLIDGNNLKFYHNDPKYKFYEPEVFDIIQMITTFLQRFLKVMLPLSISLVVFYQIQKAEFSKKVELNFDKSDTKIR